MHSPPCSIKTSWRDFAKSRQLRLPGNNMFLKQRNAGDRDKKTHLKAGRSALLCNAQRQPVVELCVLNFSSAAFRGFLKQMMAHISAVPALQDLAGMILRCCS